MALRFAIFYEVLEEECIDGHRVITKMKIRSGEFFEEDQECLKLVTAPTK